MSMEFMKLEPGQPGYLADYPQQCICGSQKGPMVATGLMYRAAPGIGAAPGTSAGQVYLCRLCVTRAGRVLGLLKGAEHERLQNAADELAEAQRQVDERQGQVEVLTRTNGEREGKIAALRAELERRDAEITHLRSFVNETVARAKDAVAA